MIPRTEEMDQISRRLTKVGHRTIVDCITDLGPLSLSLQIKDLREVIPKLSYCEAHGGSFLKVNVHHEHKALSTLIRIENREIFLVAIVTD